MPVVGSVVLLACRAEQQSNNKRKQATLALKRLEKFAQKTGLMAWATIAFPVKFCEAARSVAARSFLFFDNFHCKAKVKSDSHTIPICRLLTFSWSFLSIDSIQITSLCVVVWRSLETETQKLLDELPEKRLKTWRATLGLDLASGEMASCFIVDFVHPFFN